MKKIIIVFLLSLTLIQTQNISAKEINNFYTKADDEITIEDKINGDSFLAGNKIIEKGIINGINFSAGETIKEEGTIEYGFLAGNKITVNGNIKNSLYAAGSKIKLTENTNIEKDVFIAGETIILNGNIKRNVNVLAKKIIIEENANINGNVNTLTEELIIKNDAIITGTLKHNKDAKTNINKNASINKIIKKNKLNEAKKIETSSILLSLANIILVYIILSIILPKTFDKTRENIKDKNSKYYIKSSIKGLLILICFPILCLFLLISNVGSSLGLIMTTLYVIAIYLSYIYSGIILGEIIETKLKLKENKYISDIIGISFIKVLAIIPYIGGIISILALTIGINEIINLFKEKENNTKEKISKIKEAKIIKEIENK